MGYDFKAKEDGEMIVTFYDHETSEVLFEGSFTVKKGQAVTEDYCGVDVEWR